MVDPLRDANPSGDDALAALYDADTLALIDGAGAVHPRRRGRPVAPAPIGDRERGGTRHAVGDDGDDDVDVDDGDELPDDWWDDVDGADWPAGGVDAPHRLRRRFGVSGAALAAVMLGVAVVYDPEPDKPVVIEQAAPGEPFDDRPVQVRLALGDPAGSEIVLRPGAA